MARVTVTPEQFHLVNYDSAEIIRLASRVADEVGLPADATVQIEVDETNPFGRARIVSVDPIAIRVESGGFENAKRPKAMSETAVVDLVGLLLHRVKDRMSPGFADAPDDEKLSLQQRAAWEAYATGRCQRLGYEVSKSRRQYHFRNRHGFSNAADEVFERLWAADVLQWADIEAACAETTAARERASS